jgi:aryl hydrocarbon receptor nuclear translocator-like protein 1
LKSWAPAKIGVEEQEIDGDGELGTLSCLVAVGRVQPNIFSNTSLKTSGSGCDNSNSTHANNNGNSQGTNNGDRNTNTNNHRNLRNIQFISRHAMDGKFLFVDQRATLVLGFLPQELLGTSMYEYYHHLDLPALAESHKAVLQTSERVTTPIYRQRSKHNGFIRMQSELKSFRNPWTKELEYLIAKNNVILSEFGSIEGNVEYAGAQGVTPNPTSGAEYRSDGNSVSNYEFFNQCKFVVVIKMDDS